MLGGTVLLVVSGTLALLHSNSFRAFAAATASPLPAGPIASFKWVMPDRFGPKDKNGLVDYHWDQTTRTYDRTYINPASWKVNFDACASEGGTSKIAAYALEIGGTLIPKGSQCGFSHEFPAMGSYPVRLVVTTQDGQSASTQTDVVVKDLFIISIGDSFASGEGNPDIRAGKLNKLDFGAAVWEDKPTHRSSNAGPAQAALSIEQADPHTSVTFISFACSGAGLVSGLTGKQTKGALVLGPQIDEVLKVLKDRPNVDALLISIGGNDVGFAELVKKAIKPGCLEELDTDEGMKNRLSVLSTRFEKLHDMIKGIIPFPKVFITEYPDIVRDEGGDFCDRAPAADAMRGICAQEAEWAFNRVIIPLNEAVKSAADKWDWIYVGGIASAFRTHGYCADKDQRWARTTTDSLHFQRDILGTAHPNQGGHAWYATRLIEAMQTNGVITPLTH